MMTVIEYADDMNKKIEEILDACKSLNIEVGSEEDLLSDEDITILDGYFASSTEDNDTEENYDEYIDEEIDEIVEDIKDTKKNRC